MFFKVVVTSVSWLYDTRDKFEMIVIDGNVYNLYFLAVKCHMLRNMSRRMVNSGCMTFIDQCRLVSFTIDSSGKNMGVIYNENTRVLLNMGQNFEDIRRVKCVDVRKIFAKYSCWWTGVIERRKMFAKVRKRNEPAIGASLKSGSCTCKGRKTINPLAPEFYI